MSSTTSSGSDAGSANPNDNDTLKGLRDILHNQTHLFACGGMIPIIPPQATPKKRRSGDSVPEQGAEGKPSALSDEPKTSNPVTVRWDIAQATTGTKMPCAKVTLPLAPRRKGDLLQLIGDAAPATFGRAGVDVFDESYRKALKMDTTDFCTTFDPYSLGIIDTVAQVLLPSVIDSRTHRAVQAELYKLNVYSSPSGKFKPHVDTPRSPSQFGSLVVCLPVQHRGGQLKVRHKNEEMVFDWSTKRHGPERWAIRWAAFYSDCEHEVLKVTSGHRLTLTYNLYAVRGAGRLTGVSPTLNTVHLPLFHAIKVIAEKDPFSGQGGTLGFWCSHVYAYNHRYETPLPDTLKGVDAALWESLRALGLDPKIAPVMEIDEATRERISARNMPRFRRGTAPMGYGTHFWHSYR